MSFDSDGMSFEGCIDADDLDLAPDEESFEQCFQSTPFEGIDGRDVAVHRLTLGVWAAVLKWPKPPKARVLAAGICLALTHFWHVRGIKHPRNIAKEHRVRPKTLFAIRRVALAEIERIGLGPELMELRPRDHGKSSAVWRERLGTYNRGE